jgi:hypothetical protein
MKSLGVRQGYRLATTVQGRPTFTRSVRGLPEGVNHLFCLSSSWRPQGASLSPDGDRSAAAPAATRSHAS